MQYQVIPTITLKMLIDAGILMPGIQVFVMKNDIISGVLNHDGSISININGHIKNFPFPSGAARAIENGSVNGWIYLGVKIDDTLKNLKYFRDKYIEMTKVSD